MPVKVAKRGGRFRVVEAASGKLATAKTKSGASGKPRDGGGKSSRAAAQKIANAINRALHR